MTNARHVPIGDIKPNPNNPRIIKDDKFRKLVKSIKDFPEMLALRPIVVNSEMVVLGGNMRLKACKEAGLKEVPVILASGLTDERQREFIIKDNVGFGEWEWETLANEWDADQLAEWGLDVPEFDKVPADGLTDPDDVPESPVTPTTVLGDLWLLEKHRVLCGSSLEQTTMDLLVDKQAVDMLLTDPPYNVALGMNETPEEAKKRKRRTDGLIVKNDSMDDASFRQFLRDAFLTADTVMKPGAVFYIWHADSEGYNFRGACRDIGWTVRQCLIWRKNRLVMGRQDYHWQHEPCLYGWKDGAGHLWASDRKQTTILDFERPSRNESHPTMKPVALFEYQLLNNTKGGDIVLDSFGGSGTTLIAAERNGRVARLMELDPKYVDVIVKRWQDFTGRDAIHSVTGQTFNQMASSNERTPNG
jgi:site-specific DNA-methyltransferase (adenine-specific)